jgi:hypothetical protein
MFVLELLNCATLDPTEATTSRAMKIVFIIFLISSSSKGFNASTLSGLQNLCQQRCSSFSRPFFSGERQIGELKNPSR